MSHHSETCGFNNSPPAHLWQMRLKLSDTQMHFSFFILEAGDALPRAVSGLIPAQLLLPFQQIFLPIVPQFARVLCKSRPLLASPC